MLDNGGKCCMASDCLLSISRQGLGIQAHKLLSQECYLLHAGVWMVSVVYRGVWVGVIMLAPSPTVCWRIGKFFRSP